MGHTTVWHPTNRAGTVAGHQGDRGWGGSQSVETTPNRPSYDNAGQHRNPTPETRPAAPVTHYPPAATPYTPAASQPSRTPVEYSAPVSRPEGHGAYIGIQSPSETRNYSNRGQQSLQTATHSAPAPVSRPAPAGGGGGGSHGSGQTKPH